MKGNASRHYSVERMGFSDPLDPEEVSGEHKNLGTGRTTKKGDLWRTEQQYLSHGFINC